MARGVPNLELENGEKTSFYSFSPQYFIYDFAAEVSVIFGGGSVFYISEELRHY